MTGLHVIHRQARGEAHPTPILFVHGAWHGAWCWEEHFLDWFADRGFTVAALDLRGHGSSPARGWFRSRRLRHYVADVAEVAATFATPPVVVGHSMGGMVVQKYLERHPAPAGVLVASVPPRGILRFVLHLVRHQPRVFAAYLATLSAYPVVADPERAAALFFSDPTSPTSLAFAVRCQDEAFLATLDMLVLDLPRPKRIDTDILVIGGELDAVFPPRDVRATAAAYGTTAVMVDGAHDLMLEPCWPEVAQAIADRV